MILAIDAGFPALSCIRLSTDYSEVDNEIYPGKIKIKPSAMHQHSTQNTTMLSRCISSASST